MARIRDYTLLPSAERYAATTNGDAVDVSYSKDLAIVLNVTAIAGSPTSLDVAIQGSYDGTTFGAFTSALAFTQVTSSTGVQVLRVSDFGGKWIRAVATIVGGTTSNKYTFSVSAHGKA